MRNLIYRQLAQLLVQSRGAYGAEIARKRAVASRLMGDEAEFRHWARVREDAERLLQSNGSAAPLPASPVEDRQMPVLTFEP